MTPEDFIAHWSPGGGGYGMNERAGAQSHFMGLCALLGVDAPNHSDDYTFEKGTLKIGQKRGFAVADAALVAAVATAYGWAAYSAVVTYNEILAALPALNHERAAQA